MARACPCDSTLGRGGVASVLTRCYSLFALFKSDAEASDEIILDVGAERAWGWGLHHGARTRATGVGRRSDVGLGSRVSGLGEGVAL